MRAGTELAGRYRLELLRTGLLGDDRLHDAALARFRREGRAAARLNHRNITAVPASAADVAHALRTAGRRPSSGSRSVGIDLVTTGSVVAVLRGGRPTVVAGAEGLRATPSVVAFAGNDEVLVGEAARRQAVTDAGRTIRSVPRHLGGGATIEIDGRTFTPQQINRLRPAEAGARRRGVPR